MKYVSLFSGIGGLDLGLDRAGFRCAAQVEIDPYCRAVLAKHWPDVQRENDITTFDGRPYHGHIDLICGGFPCQDISCAGKGAGLSGERSGLWFEMLRVISEARPTWVIAENVPALRTRGIDRVLSDLEGLGYTGRPLVVGAWAVGAPHKRDRVWIVAHAKSHRCLSDHDHLRSRGQIQAKGDQSGDGDLAHAPGRGRPEQGYIIGGFVADQGVGVGLADSDTTGLEERPEQLAWSQRAASERSRSVAWPSRPGEPQHEWEAPRLAHASLGASERGHPRDSTARDQEQGLSEPGLGDATDGLPRRVASFARRSSLKALGNAVVPKVAEAIGRAVMLASQQLSLQEAA